MTLEAFSSQAVVVLGRQRQVNLWEFKASLVCRASSWTGSIATEKSCLEKPREEERRGRGREGERDLFYYQIW